MKAFIKETPGPDRFPYKLNLFQDPISPSWTTHNNPSLFGLIFTSVFMFMLIRIKECPTGLEIGLRRIRAPEGVRNTQTKTRDVV